MGVERVISQEGKNSFAAMVPGTDRALGYYSNLNNAILAHIKNAGNLDENGKEAIIELKDYIKAHRELFDEVLGLSKADVHKFATFEERPERQPMSEETKAKIKASRVAKKELENNIPIEDDEEEVF